MSSLDVFLVKSLWGNYQFDVASSESQGRSGGLLVVWDLIVFMKRKVWSMESVLVVTGEIIASGMKCFLVNVYAPQDRYSKKAVWDIITNFMG